MTFTCSLRRRFQATRSWPWALFLSIRAVIMFLTSWALSCSTRTSRPAITNRLSPRFCPFFKSIESIKSINISQCTSPFWINSTAIMNSIRNGSAPLIHGVLNFFFFFRSKNWREKWIKKRRVGWSLRWSLPPPCVKVNAARAHHPRASFEQRHGTTETQSTCCVFYSPLISKLINFKKIKEKTSAGPIACV